MKEIVREEKIETEYCLENTISNSRILYFDIETTGFLKDKNMIYLIGVVHKLDNNIYETCQWFANDEQSEKNILEEFFDYLKSFDILVSFNGEQFDIPFIKKRMEKYNIPFLTTFTSFDIYKEVKKYKKALKLINGKQKTIEEFLGIKREDTYDGGELIHVFHEYQKSNKRELHDQLLLHNFDDICGLVRISSILAYIDTFSGNFELKQDEYISQSKEHTIFYCYSKYSFKTELMILCNGIYVKLRKNDLIFLIPNYSTELKYFYKNYRDYFYLPQEDEAIHKSVAIYVDKAYRKKATKKNCYTKKQSVFLPQFQNEFEPSFKVEYEDKYSYFEIEKLKDINREQILNYLQDVMRVITK